MTREERIAALSANTVAVPVDGVCIAKAIHSAFNRNEYTVNRKGLPGRDSAEKLDHAIMGEIATNAFITYAKVSFGIPAVSYEDLRVDASRVNDSGWDVLFFPTLGACGELAGDSCLPAVTISVKSSRIPPRLNDSIRTAIELYDFKVLKYHDDVRLDLGSDIWVQVYYPNAESAANNIDLAAVAEVLKCPRLDAQGSNRISSALRVRERYASPTAIAITSSAEILAHFVSGVPATDQMQVGLSTKVIWNTKFADVGRPLTELPNIVNRVLGSRMPPGGF